MHLIGDYNRHFVCAVIKKTFDKFLLTYILLWCFARFLRWNESTIPLINNWLTDFLFVPVVAHLSVSFTRYVVLKNPLYTYPFAYLLLMVGYVSLVFEYVLPRYSEKATGDPYDVIAYFLGSLFYYYVHGKQRKVEDKS